MKTKWTPEERSAAESYAWGCQTGGKRPVSLLEVELACQRNRALAEKTLLLRVIDHILALPVFRDRSVDPNCTCTTCLVLQEANAAIAACEDQP